MAAHIQVKSFSKIRLHLYSHAASSAVCKSHQCSPSPSLELQPNGYILLLLTLPLRGSQPRLDPLSLPAPYLETSFPLILLSSSRYLEQSGVQLEEDEEAQKKLEPTVVSCYLNTAACKLKLQQWQEALDSCNEVPAFTLWRSPRLRSSESFPTPPSVCRFTLCAVWTRPRSVKARGSGKRRCRLFNFSHWCITTAWNAS